jgi:hypothetical protein
MDVSGARQPIAAGAGHVTADDDEFGAAGNGVGVNPRAMTWAETGTACALHVPRKKRKAWKTPENRGFPRHTPNVRKWRGLKRERA